MGQTLRGLPLSDVERLYTVGIRYDDFRKVQAALAAHHCAADTAATLSVAEKLLPNREYDSLDPALDAYSLAEVETIVLKKVPLVGMLDVRNALLEKQLTLGLEETIQFAQSAGWYGGWNVTQAIETFGLDDTRKILAGGCRLDKALEAKRYISGTGSGQDQQVREALSRGGLDVIIAMGRAGDMQTVARTLEAGFTVEEIVRFPFLISRLAPAPAPSATLAS